MVTFYASRLYLSFILLLFNVFPFLLVRVLCGANVYVSKFPLFFGIYSDPPGWYRIESFVFSDGQLQVGLEIKPDSVEYFQLSDLQISSFRFPSVSHQVQSLYGKELRP